MVQSNIYNSETTLETEENSGCEFTEQRNTNDSFQDEWNRLSERFDKDRSLGNKSYLAFKAMEKVYQYRAILFGTQHSPILFAQALAMVLTKIRRESDIRILNYVDDLLLLHQNKERLREQTLIIMKILEAFGWKIAQEKCEVEPKQQINFLGQNLTNPDQDKISSINNGQAEFLRVQVRDASLYLKLMESAKTRALKNKKWVENMILPQEILQELYGWQGVIVWDQEMTLE
ncbi:MAG: hypothetical protein EZS28_052413, partial [Streblomastix strix]